MARRVDEIPLKSSYILLWLLYSKDDSLVIFALFYSFQKNLVAGVAETGDNIPVLVQSFIDRGGTSCSRPGLLHCGNPSGAATSTSTLAGAAAFQQAVEGDHRPTGGQSGQRQRHSSMLDRSFWK